MVATSDLGSDALRRGGSSPFIRTFQSSKEDFFCAGRLPAIENGLLDPLLEPMSVSSEMALTTENFSSASCCPVEFVPVVLRIGFGIVCCAFELYKAYLRRWICDLYFSIFMAIFSI